MKFKENASETQDREVREGGVKGKGRKYAGGGTWSGQTQQDFERGSAGQNGKYGIRKCRRERKYMGEKGRGIKGSTLEEGPGAGRLNRILGGKVPDKSGSTGK